MLQNVFNTLQNVTFSQLGTLLNMVILHCMGWKGQDPSREIGWLAFFLGGGGTSCSRAKNPHGLNFNANYMINEYFSWSLGYSFVIYCK